jgi:hypothetical protein
MRKRAGALGHKGIISLQFTPSTHSEQARVTGHG